MFHFSLAKNSILIYLLENVLQPLSLSLSLSLIITPVCTPLSLQMLDLLFEYVDLSMTTLCPEKGKMEELEEYYQVRQ